MSGLTVGFDIAKNIFQIHAVDSSGEPVIRRKLRRSAVLSFFAKLEPSVIGIEACSTAHHWGRALSELGHEVKLMAPNYVKPYVKRSKTDAADAEAICEAVARPTMRFVPIKTTEQQAVLMIHRARSVFVRQRTMLVNAIRSHLAEFGLVTGLGVAKTAALVAEVLSAGEDECPIPEVARTVIRCMADQVAMLDERIRRLDAELTAWHRENAASRLLATIPGIGVVTATAIAATVPDPVYFGSGRAFAAWLGLTPRANSSGGKERLGRITKMGSRYIRTLLVVGATAVIRSARMKDGSWLAQWARALLEKKPARVVTVALANKMARIAWAILTRGDGFKPSLITVD
jgi:transposase